MPDDVDSTSPSGGGGRTGPAVDPAPDLGRLADLVIQGDIGWPSDLSEARAAELTAVIRRRLRSRLVRLVGRQVAAELARDRPYGVQDARVQV